MLRLLYWLLFGCDVPAPAPKAHVCDEFTRWKTCVSYVRNIFNYTGEGGIVTPMVSYAVKRWQERRCTTCGILYQRLVEHGGRLPLHPDDDFSNTNDARRAGAEDEEPYYGDNDEGEED